MKFVTRSGSVNLSKITLPSVPIIPTKLKEGCENEDFMGGCFYEIEKAIRNDDWVRAQQLITEYGGVNLQGYYTHNTPLHVAVIWRKVDIVTELINNHANVNISNANKCKPLDFVACHIEDRDIAIFEKLLAAGATFSEPRYIGSRYYCPLFEQRSLFEDSIPRTLPFFSKERNGVIRP